MLDQFKAISISWKHAPLDLREKISIDEVNSKHLLGQIRELFGITEALILSTCNRTEIYYSSPNKDLSTEIIKLLCIHKGVEDTSTYLKSFRIISDHNEAVEHLFEVSMGLDAQVIGDMQISNQVKKAYQWSADENLAGPFLHRLMHTIFFTNKRVVQETSFRDGAASISYAAVELVEELSLGINNPKVLVIGLGEMGHDVASNLVNTKLSEVVLANRTLETAKTLAEACDFEYIDYSDIWSAIDKADIVVSSVSSQDPIITAKLVSQLTLPTFKYFIDISVPRSVEKEVENVSGAIVYNIDSIKTKASKALEKRKASIPQVQSIIKDALTEFRGWSQEMEVSPTIQKLKNALENIRKEEISRYLKNLNDEECDKIDLITKNIMQKILKLPVLQLKAACKRGEAETLIDVLNDLFNLEKEEVTEK